MCVRERERVGTWEWVRREERRGGEEGERVRFCEFAESVVVC